MLKLRRFMIAAVVALSSFIGFGAAAVPAGAFCDTSDGCSPCGGELVIEGKNTRIEFHQC